MKNVLFPRTRIEGTSLPARRATAIPRWVIVWVVLILLLVLAYLLLHHGGNGMDHMPLSFGENGRLPR